MPSLAEPATCAAVAEALPRVLDGRAEPPLGLSRHIEHCLACQAELARYRRLLRMLAQLGRERAELSPGALADLLEAVEGAARRSVIRSALAGRRLAYGAGLIGGVLAAAALVAASKLRTTRRPASA